MLDGSNAAHPKPKSFKLNKNQLFPDKDLVFDYVYDKRNNGTWIPWAELEKEVPIPANAKVIIVFMKQLLLSFLKCVLQEIFSHKYFVCIQIILDRKHESI